MLAEKYSGLQRTARKRMEESAETVLRDEDLLNLRDEVAELTKQARIALFLQPSIGRDEETAGG